MCRLVCYVCLWISLTCALVTSQNITDGVNSSSTEQPSTTTSVHTTTTTQSTTTKPQTHTTRNVDYEKRDDPVGMVTKASFIEYYNEHNSSRKPDIWKDEAWLTINSTVKFKLLIYSQTEECWRCPLLKFAEATGDNTTTISISTIALTEIKLAKELASSHIEDICSFTTHFREGGDYWLFMDEDAYIKGVCEIEITNDPMVSEMPLLFLLIALVLLAILWTLVSMILRRWRGDTCECLGHSAAITNSTQISDSIQTFNLDQIEKENGTVSHDPDLEPGDRGETSTEQQSVQEEQPKKKQRLRSLDAFRGLCLIVMVFVNYGGGGYWFFEHPPWNGLTVADLVFPWFIFIMGTSMNYAFRGMVRRKTKRLTILFKIIKRAVLLFGFGIILNTNWGPVDLNHVRILSILQRIALTYFGVAMVEFIFLKTEDSHQEKKWAPVRDVILHLPEWGVHLCILGVFLGITYALPVPGCPTGYTGPAGISIDSKYENCSGGAARYIDVAVLGEEHLYQYPTLKQIYKTKVPFDPEGILGTLSTIFLCFLGVQAGRILMTFDSHMSRCIRWLVWAAITGVIAAILCQGSANEGWVPLNKNLWSVSFVLATASFAFVLLTVMYVIIDVFHIWTGAPFVYPGMNSIVVYLCHEVFYRFFPVNWYVDPVHWKLLLQDTWATAIFITLAFVLHQKGIFIAL